MINMKKGFTLIELLVVISVISLLSTIVLENIQDARGRAEGAAFRRHVEEFILAVELYRADNNGTLPDGSITTYFDVGSPDEDPSGLFDTTFGNYIGEVPTTPFNDYSYFDYNYYTSETCQGYSKFIDIDGIDGETGKYFQDWPFMDGYTSVVCYPLE